MTRYRRQISSITIVCEIKRARARAKSAEINARILANLLLAVVYC